MPQVVGDIGKIRVSPVLPYPELGNRLQVVRHRAPRFLRSLNQITSLELLVSVLEESVAYLQVIVDLSLIHEFTNDLYEISTIDEQSTLIEEPVQSLIPSFR